MSTKRFRIALSFAGEKRDFVSQVADILASHFSKDEILYDKFHEAEFANWKLGLLLQDYYHDHSDMIVVVVCPDYSKRNWCGLEWLAIHGMLMSGKDREIMLCRFMHAKLQGLNENAGYVELDDKSPEQTATLILERLALIEGRSTDYYSRHLSNSRRGSPQTLDVSSINLGFVGAALDRAKIPWPLANTPNVVAMFEKVRPGGELFIVARSLERWYQPENYLRKLGKLIVERNLRCTIAIPDPHRRVRSLVADDPSQNFRLRMWNEIKSNLAAFIDENQNSGRLEIYGIPAYVPSTFLAITSDDNIDYCSLEVGIGVPPGNPGPPRVHVVFRTSAQSEPNRHDLYNRLESIYRGILKERVPLLRLPGGPCVYPETNQELKARYKEAKELLLSSETNIISTNQRANTDLFDGDGNLFTGQAVCLATLPIGQYHGGRDAIDLAGAVRTLIEDSVWPGHPKLSRFRWLDPSSMFVPIFWYKRSFYELFDLLEQEKSIFQEMQQWLEKEISALSIEFTRLIVDPNGIVYLAGIERPNPTDKSLKPLLTEIRNKLDEFCDNPNARHTPRRPLDILLPIGHMANQPLTDDETKALKRCIDAHFVLSQIATPLHIDRLRMVTLQMDPQGEGLHPSLIKEVEGFARIYLRENPGWLRYFAEGKTKEGPNRTSAYGVLSPRKWLAHPTVVDHVKSGQFTQIKPVTVQVSPTLRCTNRCLYCSYGAIKEPLLSSDAAGKAKPPKSKKARQTSTVIDMSRNDLISVIRQFGEGGVKGMIFTGGGEPLKNPDTIEGMLYARRRLLWENPESRDARNRPKWLSVGLFTNGQLLNRDDGIVKIARDIDPTFVRVSLNAGNSEVYSLIHGTRNSTGITFKNVLANIERLAEAKRDYNSSFKLDIGVLITPLILDNLLDLAFELKRIAFRYPGRLNSVAFRPAVWYRGGCWNREGLKGCVRYLESDSRRPEYRGFGKCFQDFILEGKQFPRDVFNKAISIINKEVRPILAASLRETDRIDVSVPELRFDDVASPLASHKHTPCVAAPLVSFVGPDTSVYHCVERAFDPALRYGKLNEKGLQSILADGRHQSERCWQDGCPPVCLLHEYNEVFSEIITRLEGNEKDCTQHEIDVAAEYFKERVALALGPEVADFI